MEEWTIREIQKKIDEGSLTSYDLTVFYLKRIARLDPALHSVAELNPDALFIAQALDMEREKKGKRSLLHGIPILLKDNIDTGDKMHTTAGTIALENAYAKEDAPLVKALRKAGAVILGKANLSELANFFGDGIPSGFSTRCGQVVNPYDKNISPSGSSSGSGVAVAAHLCTAAVGTETDGSIIYPAEANSVVGIKPTVGLISRSGIIPISSTQDTAGPMAKTVEDAAVLLEAMRGYDEKDAATYRLPFVEQESYLAALDTEKAKGMRVGVYMENFDTLKEEQKALWQEAILAIKTAGIQVIEIKEGYGHLLHMEESPLLSHEFKSGLNYYLATHENEHGIHTLTDLIDFNEKHKEICLKYNQEEIKRSDKKSGRLTEPEYIGRLLYDRKISKTEGIDKVLAEKDLDALVFPCCTSAPARSGNPCISVPAGRLKDHNGFNIIFTGLQFTEAKLLTLAYAYERNSLKRRPPCLLEE